MLTLILGGARSGKSGLAQHLAARARRVCYVATAQAGDDPEMRQRIERHRVDRPNSWRTVEEPLALADAVDRAASDSDAIIVDCLTIWLSNLFWQLRDEPPNAVEDSTESHLRRVVLASTSCHVILVSNEVGWATIPETAVTRAFRDAQGILNQRLAAVADEVILVVAGLPHYLKNAAQRGAAS
jgi:adenosylcobinamide kinase / adenosylcobinamide-phosphate guanylyltransferase